jgi:type IX secretion system PorP/SprF family membrane protein
MKLYKIIAAVFSLMLAAHQIKAQQETQQSLYFFNPLLINPSYAGSQEALTAIAVVRNQWANFKGAPKTQILTVHSPLKKQNLGLGLTVLNDELGSSKNTGAYVDFSYSIRLNKKNHRLVFGLKAGTDFYRQDFSNLKIQDNTDNIYLEGFNYSKFLFNAGAGVYYYGKRFYLGASSPRLIKNTMNLPGGQKAVQENHLYGFGGLVIKLNSAVNMRPSFIVKYVHNAPLSVDGNLSFLFYQKVWLGALYRYNSAAGVNAAFYITENFLIGYAFDYTLNQIQQHSAGSHEIMLSYDLKSKSKGFRSPRYF